MKRLMALLVAAMMLVSLASCQTGTSSGSQTGTAPATGTQAGAATGSTASGESSGERIVLRFWQAGADTADATNTMNGLLSGFMQKNADITVEYQAYPWANDPHVAFQTAIASGNVGDLLIVGNPFEFVLAGSDQVLALDDYIDQAVKDDLMDVFANECVYHGTNTKLEGKQISIPLYGDARTILYNKAIFDEAGVAYPDKSWTQDEFIANAKKLTGTYGGKKVYGFGTSAYYSSQYITFVWNYGGDILNDAQNAAATNTDAWKKGITDYLRFFKEGMTPPGSEAMKLADMMTMFINGEIAMMVATSDYATEIQANEAFGADKLGVGIMPHADKQTAYGGADVFVIPTLSQHPNESGKLINYLLQTENELKYTKGVGFTPAVKSAASDSYFTDDPVKAAFADAVEHAKFYVKTSYANGVTPILRADIQELIAGNLTLEEYLTKLTDDLNALIAEQQ